MAVLAATAATVGLLTNVQRYAVGMPRAGVGAAGPRGADHGLRPAGSQPAAGRSGPSAAAFLVAKCCSGCISPRPSGLVLRTKPHTVTAAITPHPPRTRGRPTRMHDKTGRLERGERRAARGGPGARPGDAARGRGAIGIDILDLPHVEVVGDAFEVVRSLPDASVRSVFSAHFF